MKKVIDFRMASLKRLFCAFAVFSYGLAAFFFYMNRQEAVAKVLIPPQIPFFALPQEVVEQAALKINASADVKRAASQLLSSVRVKRDAASGILSVRCSGWNRGSNVAKVNQIVLALKDYSDEILKKQSSNAILQLEKTLKSLESEIDALRNHVERLRKESEPDEVDLQLARAYQAKKNRYEELLRTFKEEYPEIVKLKGEMASLQAQIMDAPFPDPALLKQAASELTSKEAELRLLRQRRDEMFTASLDIKSQISIISLAPTQPQHSSQARAVSWVTGALLLLILCFFFTRSN